ncbi:protein TNT [Tamandua tetradactyla]|uniref:protein TNT n=1 Tax=Tamandua tetradactyla TaxID=48850 RepID=UPI004053FDB1
MRRCGWSIQAISQHSVASQGPFPLDKDIKLPPIFLRGGKGESSACDAEGQDPSLQSPSLALQHQDAAVTKELPRASYSSLPHTWSSESDVMSFQYPSLDKSSNISLVSSGYAADKESSESSVVCNSRLTQLGRGLKTQASHTQTNQLCSTYRPSQPKNPDIGQADSKQAGGEK